MSTFHTHNLFTSFHTHDLIVIIIEFPLKKKKRKCLGLSFKDHQRLFKNNETKDIVQRKRKEDNQWREALLRNKHRLCPDTGSETNCTLGSSVAIP